MTIDPLINLNGFEMMVYTCVSGIPITFSTARQYYESVNIFVIFCNTFYIFTAAQQFFFYFILKTFTICYSK